MSGISSKLPLSLDPEDGIALNKDIQSVVRQNLINLILTNPGERVMISDFGVGIKRFLFEQDNAQTRGSISGKIAQQVEKFMPFISIDDISFNSNSSNPAIDRNILFITISYTILPIDFPAAITFSADNQQETITALDRDDLVRFV